MDSEASHQSHALRWTLGVLTALLLYVLSWGPVGGLHVRYTIPYPAVEWLNTFYRPLTWLHNNTPLQKPLELYVQWWIHILAKP